MTVREIGIFGSSGFAREVADIATTLGYRPFFIAQNKRSAENISESDVILESEITKFKFPAYAIGVGDNRVRKTIFQKFSNINHGHVFECLEKNSNSCNQNLTKM